MYGGTQGVALTGGHHRGLSPRVRGNRPQSRAACSWRRSIPACTGEPLTPCLVGDQAKVYPRVYGGTSSLVAQVTGLVGLSPRVRGNQPTPDPEKILARSIPACTGEPPIQCDISGNQAVYPRVYGGTPLFANYCKQKKGLSPRVRGNLCVRITHFIVKEQVLQWACPVSKGLLHHDQPTGQVVFPETVPLAHKSLVYPATS